ncbi:hypothetical protein, partial [Salinispora arenicola]|uniref:hypothetical protein n=1 Tax=Salinispora arenicola TaxID=168697 RepID=UPI001E60D84C
EPVAGADVAADDRAQPRTAAQLAQEAYPQSAAADVAAARRERPSSPAAKPVVPDQKRDRRPGQGR